MSEPIDLFGQSNLRADGTKKGLGYYGKINLPGGGYATEYSIGVNFDDNQIEIPTLVPTLTREELDYMVNTIIPEGGKVPDVIYNKAVNQALNRMESGLSAFANEEDALINKWKD